MGKPNVLVVDDEAVIREGMRRILEEREYRVHSADSGQAALERLQQDAFDVVITDLKMPGMGGMEVLKAIRVLQPEVPVIVITGYSAVETAVEVMKNGAFDYLAKPFNPAQIVGMIEKALEQKSFMVHSSPRGEDLPEKGFDLFIGNSPQIRLVYRRILQVAPTDSTVLIHGESGTGKELVARAIHSNSQRQGRPFVTVDCTSLAETLLESELFGHVKGSFTGAFQTKTGLFETADGGTLFLDEISNICLTTQAKLLRVLQEREVTPIGGTRPIPINIRLIAATNRDLKEMLRAGTFREDLYFRLNIIPIQLPVLRERKGDLPLLVNHFLSKFARETGKAIRGLTPGAMTSLESYPFPGNVRELENIIERAVVLTGGDLIRPENLEMSGAQSLACGSTFGPVPETAEELKESKRRIREQAVHPIERAFVLDALNRNGWNITRAALEVGMLRPNFQALLKKQGISVRDRSLA
jgi:DNA-binding NtrC family response regulator